jgi:hypothetical protein
VTRKLRRIVSLLLCLSTFFGVLVPQALAMPAHDMGSMSMSHSDGAPCGDCDEGTPSACDEHCAALSGGMLLPMVPLSPQPVVATNSVVSTTVIDFESYAGPPGLQPPR